jgi:transposase-like protein
MASRKRPKNRGGRPSKWTPETARALGAAFKRGTSIGDIARRTGVGKCTLHRWHRAALKGSVRCLGASVQGSPRALAVAMVNNEPLATVCTVRNTERFWPYFSLLCRPVTSGDHGS